MIRSGLIPRLALRSVLNRKLTAALTVFAIALSLALFLGVQKIRQGAESSFEQTISGVDLIVGARGGETSLILYSVFHIGNPTANISWETYRQIAEQDSVAWTIPLSLGDSHRGFRVVGTTNAFFDHYRYGRGNPLVFTRGHELRDLFDVVIGSDVARALNYAPGDEIVVSHGIGAVSFSDHANLPFTVAGILAPTGTPVDKTLMVSLEAIEAIHIGWESGAPGPMARAATEERVRGMDIRPTQVTALYVGMASRTELLRFQRAINTYRQEPLTAVLPGVALRQIWNVVGVVERALGGIALFVVFVGLLTILTSILTSLNERRREMAVLRAIGARPWHVFALLVTEAGLLALLGGLASLVFLYGGLALIAPVAEQILGLRIGGAQPGLLDLAAIAGVVAASCVLALIPAVRAYRNALADGLTIRL